MSTRTGSADSLGAPSAFWGKAASGFVGELFSGVRWSPAYLALLYYTCAVTTYQIAGARYAMIVAVVALLIEVTKLRFSPWLAWLFALAGWAWVSAIGSGGSPIAIGGAQDIGKLAIISFVIFNAVRSPSQLRFYIAFVVGCALLYPIRGALVNYLGGYSTFGRALWNYAYANPNDLAGFCLVFLSLTLAYLHIGKHKLWRMGAIGASGVIAIVIFLTQSRGAFLALVATTVMGIMLVRQRGRAFGVMAVVAILSVPFVPDSAWARFGGLRNASTATGMRGVDREGSAQQRFQVLQVAMRISGDNPLFGVGPMMYPEVAPRYGTMMSSQYALARRVTDPHNTYLRLSTELGIPGLLLFLGMIISVITRTWSTSSSLIRRGEASSQVLRMLLLGLVAFLLAGLFSSIPYINVLYILTAIMGSLVACANELLAAPASAFTPKSTPTVGASSGSGVAIPWGQRGGLATARLAR
jgi:O-antigen ligase